MSKYQTQIEEQFNAYLENNEKFFEKGNKAASVRARKALLELSKLCKEARKEILEEKNAQNDK